MPPPAPIRPGRPPRFDGGERPAPGQPGSSPQALAPLHVPARPVRFVTAASLFDGHDAAINIMRRLLQAQGAEVIHLGHNRSVDDVVTAAVQEDVKGIAVSSYQGGHVEYFKYLVDRLRAEGRPGIRVYGGGGGTIIAGRDSRASGLRGGPDLLPPGRSVLGLAAMVNTLIAECDHPAAPLAPGDVDSLLGGDQRVLARVLTVARGRATSRRWRARRFSPRPRPTRPRCSASPEREARASRL